ncbi:MAG TPA: hypothetical protein VM581_04015 [Magnetospirillaceae bacterium]|nr:hypothetical protein [Magnetospirillaceae bacterium]
MRKLLAAIATACYNQSVHQTLGGIVFRFIFNRLTPEAVEELAPFAQYNRKSPEAMAKSGYAYLELPDVKIVEALARFIERWGSQAQVKRLWEIVEGTGD